MTEDPTDIWNGYFQFLKSGDVEYDLMAGRYTKVGTVIYTMDNGNFMLTYNLKGYDWVLEEAHMFAVDKAVMPVTNKKNPNLKIGLFPYHAYPNPGVDSLTFTIPLTSLPNYENRGYVVAAHCVVRNVNTNQEETAWGKFPNPFTDNDWGWYDTLYFQQTNNEFTILFGTKHSNDSLMVFQLDMTNGSASLILKEYVGNTSGSYDGTAYDPETSMLYFTNYATGDLYRNDLSDEYESVWVGSLNGIAGSGAFYDNAFYYVDELGNTVNKVTISSTYTIESEIILDEIPYTVSINDICLSPDGTEIYMIGDVANTNYAQFIKYVISTSQWSYTTVYISDGSQIAYGQDGILYAVSQFEEGDNYHITYGTINPVDGTYVIIDDDVIIEDNVIIDVSEGFLK